MAIQSAVVRYADRFHRAVQPGHHVASPLGAWLVIALAAPAARGALPDDLADALGMDGAAAAQAARTLLEHPHPLVASAAAMWHRESVETDALRAWQGGLPPSVERGPVPSQAGADRWASDHTLGLIEQFPLQMTPETVLVLASALATRVSWQSPYDLAPATDLRSTSWPQLTQVLRSTVEHGQYIARTAVGDVAVHRAWAEGGLAVVSVIAAADVPAADVLTMAHEIALTPEPARLSLFDLPLGDGPLWTITEEQTEITGRRGERCTALLPAWSASSEHDLTDLAALGFPAAAGGLIALLPPDDHEFTARQAAMARYTRVGFEAAAVTAIGIRAMGFVEPRQGLLRRAELRFAHPFASVAVVDDTRSRWHGLPVFSAWVAEPDDATSS